MPVVNKLTKFAVQNNGFDASARDTISVDVTGFTVTLSTSAPATYYISGKRYIWTDPIATDFAPSGAGTYLMYFDADGFHTLKNPTSEDFGDIFHESLPIAAVTYNTTHAVACNIWIPSRELAGTMRTIAFAQHVPAVYDAAVYKTGNDWQEDAGTLRFIDHKMPIAGQAAGASRKQMWLTATGPEYMFATNPVVLDTDLGIGSDGLVVVNNGTTPTAVANNSWCWYFIVNQNEIGTALFPRTFSVMGDQAYGNEPAAVAALADEYATVLSKVNNNANVRYAVLVQSKTAAAYLVDSVKLLTSIPAIADASDLPPALVAGPTSDADSYHTHDSKADRAGGATNHILKDDGAGDPSDSGVLILEESESGSILRLTVFGGVRSSSTSGDLWVENDSGTINLAVNVGGTEYRTELT